MASSNVSNQLGLSFQDRGVFCAGMLSRNLHDTFMDRNSLSFSPCNRFPVENPIFLCSFYSLTSLGHEVATQQGHGGEPAWVGSRGVG